MAEYYTSEDTAYLGFLCDNLEGDTNGLQAFLGMMDIIHLNTCTHVTSSSYVLLY